MSEQFARQSQIGPLAKSLSPHSQPSDLPRFEVTFVSRTERDPAVLITPDGETALSSGTELYLGVQIETRSGRVELRDEHGMILRLGERSEAAFEFDSNLKRHVFSYFGRGFKKRLTQLEPFTLQFCGKYRTSCFNCPCPICIENHDPFTDIYYAFLASVPVFEYDEQGEWFLITEIPEGYKATLVHDPSKPMRERYSVAATAPITEADYDRITDEYLNPKRWR